MQSLGKRKTDKSFVNTRIRYLSEFDVDGHGNKKELGWCGGTVENNSNGAWVNAGK